MSAAGRVRAAGRAAWAAALAGACAAPGVRTVCEKSGFLGEDGRCYDVVGDSAAPVEAEEGGGADGAVGLPEVEGEALRAAWDGPALTAALEAAAAEGLPTPFSLAAGYAEVMGQGDARCPGDPYELDGRFLRGCTASSGAFYSGVSNWVPIHSRGRLEYGVNGDFMLFDRAGRRLEVGGGVGWNVGSLDDPVMKITQSVTAIWEGDPGSLATGLSASMEGTLSRAGGDLSMELHGSIGFSGYALAFRRATLLASCRGAEGVVELRDPGLGWHRLDFGPSCAPCADWSFQGVEMGELCVDLSPLIHTYADAWSAL